MTYKEAFEKVHDMISRCEKTLELFKEAKRHINASEKKEAERLRGLITLKRQLEAERDKKTSKTITKLTHNERHIKQIRL